MTIHARKTTSRVSAARLHRHVLRRHQDAVRPRRAGERHASRSSRPTATIARGATAKLDSLAYLAAARPEGHRSRHRQGVHADSRRVRRPSSSSTCRSSTTSRARTSRSPARLKDGSYKLVNGELVFERTLHGLRNTVLLPAGLGRDRGLAVGDDRPARRSRVRRADQPERGEQLQGHDSRAAEAVSASRESARLIDRRTSPAGSAGARSCARAKDVPARDPAGTPAPTSRSSTVRPRRDDVHRDVPRRAARR